jgi:DNA (cytosine-5)-methyltransferase 1
MQKEINHLDLFSGIGGFSKGIVDTGVKINKHYFSEVDKNAISIYKRHFPGAIELGSVERVRGCDLDKINLITFGAPCQDLSIAGQRRGLAGERSGLVFEALRLIKECQPDDFIYENVKGLFSSNGGKDFTALLRAFTELGIYCIEWELLNSKHFGVAQNRERVFIHGFRRESSRQIFPLGGANEQDSISVKIVAHKDGYRRNSQTFAPDGITEALDTAQGGGRGHHTAIRINMGVAEETKDEALCLDKSYHKGFDNHGQRTGIAVDRQPIRSSRSDDPFKPTEEAPTVRQSDKADIRIMEGYRIRRLTPIECERLQAFPDNWTALGSDGKKMSDSARYKALGNAVTTSVIQAIVEKINEVQCL